MDIPALVRRWRAFPVDSDLAGQVADALAAQLERPPAASYATRQLAVALVWCLCDSCGEQVQEAAARLLGRLAAQGGDWQGAVAAMGGCALLDGLMYSRGKAVRAAAKEALAAFPGGAAALSWAGAQVALPSGKAAAGAPTAQPGGKRCAACGAAKGASGKLPRCSGCKQVGGQAGQCPIYGRGCWLGARLHWKDWVESWHVSLHAWLASAAAHAGSAPAMNATSPATLMLIHPFNTGVLLRPRLPEGPLGRRPQARVPPSAGGGRGLGWEAPQPSRQLFRGSAPVCQGGNMSCFDLGIFKLF